MKQTAEPRLLPTLPPQLYIVQRGSIIGADVWDRILGNTL